MPQYSFSSPYSGRWIDPLPTSLESALGHGADGLFEEAKHLRDQVLPAMLAVRTSADALENVVADDLWPLPTYQEMLFIR